MSDDVIKAFTQPAKHGALVAMVMNGIFISIAILIFDILACYVVISDKHEYSLEMQGGSLNLYIVFGTLICDMLFILPLLLSITYIMGNRQACCKCDIAPSMRCSVTSAIISLLIGKKTFNKISQLSYNDSIAVMFSAMLISPLLCFTSHLGYVMLAWLTEPSKCTTILILFYIIYVYFFFAFKKCYKHYAGIVISCKCLRPAGYERSVKSSKTIISLEECCPPNTIETRVDYRPMEQIENSLDATLAKNHKELTSYTYCCLTIDKFDEKHLNTQAFCLIFFFGLFFLCVVVMIISIIIVLPLSSEELVTYLFSIFQLTIVIISTQVAYELYFGSSFSIKNVFHKFREIFAIKSSKSYNRNLVDIAQDHTTYPEIDDATGAFAAELTDVIIQKFRVN